MSIFPTMRFIIFEFPERDEFDTQTGKQKICMIYLPTDLPGSDYDIGEFYEFFAGEDVNLDEYLAYHIYKTGLVDSGEFDFWLNDEEGRAEHGGHFIEITVDELEPGKIHGLIEELKMAIEREFYIMPPGSLKKFLPCTFEIEFHSSLEQALEEYTKLLGLQGKLLGIADRWLRKEQRPERTFRKTPVGA